MLSQPAHKKPSYDHFVGQNPLASYRTNWERTVSSRIREIAPPQEACLRLVDNETHSPLRMDKLGPVAWFYWYGSPEIIASQSSSRQLIQLAELADCPHAYVRVMKDRGSDASEHMPLALSEGPPERWLGHEGKLTIELRADCGLSPGIFLDQRQNRNWVFEHAKGCRMLNLFAYTCLFSAAGALGGATEVTSVDTSHRYLEWGKQNFLINHLALEPHRFQRQDVRAFLGWAKRTGQKYDLVICDPPSFARNKQGLFRIDRDLEGLLDDLLKVLAPSGTLLFCTNFAGWGRQSLRRRLQPLVRSTQRQLRPAPGPGPDFYSPPTGGQMLSYLIGPQF